MNLFYQPDLPQGVHYLDPNESRHVVKVLRKRPGEKIRITDGHGFFYDATITISEPDQCSFNVINKIEEARRPFSIHVAISPTKNTDRIDWFVEKSIELGIDEITLMACAHSERQNLKVDRLEKIAISAMKQSLKARLPVMHPPTNFGNVLLSKNASQKFIAYVDSNNPDHLKSVAQPGSSYLILIGPEGDFSNEELRLAALHDFRKVSLGTSRLRTETAGVAACHILNLANTP